MCQTAAQNAAEPVSQDLDLDVPEHIPEERAPEPPELPSSALPLLEVCHSDSDVELVLVRHAKRARPTVKVERLLQGMLVAKKKTSGSKRKILKRFSVLKVMT